MALFCSLPLWILLKMYRYVERYIALGLIYVAISLVAFILHTAFKIILP